MLKNLKKVIGLLGCCVTLSSCMMSGVDLESVTLQEDVTALIKDRKKSVDQLEMLSGLPDIQSRMLKDTVSAPWKLLMEGVWNFV